MVNGSERTKTFKNKKAADAYRANVENNGAPLKRTTMTVGEALEAYLTECERRGLTRTTLVGYEGSIRRHLMPALGKIKLCDLTSDRCQQLIDDVSSRFKRAQIRTHLVLKATLRFAVRKKLGGLTHNILIVDPITLPKGRKCKPTHATREELMDLVQGL